MGRKDQGVEKSLHRYQVIPRVLVFVLDGDRVLLLRGAPHKRLWANKYNGLGGHVEQGEDVFTAALREVHEESGIEVSNLRLRGVVTIDVGQPVGILLFVFLADAVTTEPRPSSEGSLEWVPLHALADRDVVEDITVILPEALAADRQGAVFFAHYAYDSQDNLLITWPARAANSVTYEQTEGGIG